MNVLINKLQRLFMSSLHGFYSLTNCSGRVNSSCWSWGSPDSVTIDNSCCVIILFIPWPVANGVSFIQFNHKHYWRLFCNLEYNHVGVWMHVLFNIVQLF